MTKDYKKLAETIIRLSGGVGNISSASHCMTRLRLNLVDEAKFDNASISALPEVLTVVVQNGEHQIVIGQDVPNLYAEVQKIDGIKEKGYVEDPDTAREDIALDKKLVRNTIT
jgi:PTS system beta-glucosides-specific IIC component